MFNVLCFPFRNKNIPWKEKAFEYLTLHVVWFLLEKFEIILKKNSASY